MADSYKDFFERGVDYRITANYYGCTYSFTIEEMYQAFAARSAAELSAELATKRTTDDGTAGR